MKSAAQRLGVFALALAVGMFAGAVAQAQQIGTAARPTVVVMTLEGETFDACGARFEPLPAGGYFITFEPCVVLFRGGFEADQ